VTSIGDASSLARVEKSSLSSSPRAGRRRGAPNKPLGRPLQQPVAFKAAIYAKGWSLKALADRWGITLDGLLKLARDEDRSLHFDDAVRGLKKIGPPIKLRNDWKAVLAGEQPPAQARKPGLRYRGYFVVGAVVAAIKSIGSIAEEGMRGIVVQVVAGREEELYRVLFETGELELFAPAQVDEHLQDVGLQREALMQYRYVDDVTVSQHFDEGLFEF
jgi:hypothetical protein